MNLHNLFNNETDVAEYPDGHVVFAEGEPGDAMYVLVAGSIRLSVRDIEIGHLEPGELFGEMALIDAEPRSATATACGHCKVARVDERRFTFLVQQHPFFALHVMRVLAARLRHMDDTLH